jgi:hypothetical protein
MPRSAGGDAAVFDCRGLDQKGKLLELSLPPRTEERSTPLTMLCAASD